MWHILTVLAGIVALVLYAPPPYPPQRYGRVAVDDLRTGDILLFKSRDPQHPLDALMTTFTHAGLVICWGRKVYVLEAHGAEPGRPAGVYVHDLLQRLQTYNGDIWGSLGWSNRSGMDAWPLVQQLPFYLSKSYDDSYRWTYLKGRRNPEDSRLYCSELVVLALRDLGVSTSFNPQRTTPDDLLGVYGTHPVRVVPS